VLELAHRLWPGAEGWFSSRDALFNVQVLDGATFMVKYLVDRLAGAGVKGELSSEEQAQLDELESRKRALRKENEAIATHDEQRRIALGKRRREGALTFGEPFNLRIGWWQEDNEETPKTFAGRQEVLRMAGAMLSEVSKTEDDAPLEYRCLLQTVRDESRDTSNEKSKRWEKQGSKVEPFYLDAERFAHSLDAGFSLDVQEKTVRATAAPLTELFSLIGLERFRPQSADYDKWTFQYFTWGQPLSAVAAAAVACGTVPVVGQKGYRFRLQFRDDQKRYKAFGYAIPMGDDI
jgi:CRISPR-associated protein Csx14